MKCVECKNETNGDDLNEWYELFELTCPKCGGQLEEVKGKPVRLITRPHECDICTTELLEGYIDGKTVEGPWANMCFMCYKDHGIGLGLGRGQAFNCDGVKIAG